MSTQSKDPIACVLRLFTILHLVSTRRPGRPIGRKALADACECSVKTIQRDIFVLQSAHIPIDYDKTEHTYILPDKGWTLPAITLTTTDAFALSFLRGMISGRAAHLPYTDQIEMALEKVTAGLLPELRRLMDAVSASIQVTGGMARDYSHASIELLLIALRKKRTVEMLYESRSAGERKWRKIDPYRLDVRDGRYLDLQAWCHNNNEVRTFALDRIHEARLTDLPFTIRPWEASNEGVVSGLRSKTFVDVVVRIDAETASYAQDKKNWPFTARFEPQEDGGVIMRGRVQGFDGIIPVLLSWRSHLEVLGSPELRARMIEELHAMAELYGE